MIVTIHQPEHMPWPGFFHKMAHVDLYVLLDTVQFTKNNWQNRNRFIDRDGQVFWLTVPIVLRGHTSTSIKDIRISPTQEWQRKYWGRLYDSYLRHPFFDAYADEVRNAVMQEYEYLVDVNYCFIEFFRKHLGIGTQMIKASALSVTGKRSELLANICKELGATTYLSGPSGRHYLAMDFFVRAGINVQYHEFEPPVYPATHYEPFLSTFDILMNLGPESRQAIGL